MNRRSLLAGCAAMLVANAVAAFQPLRRVGFLSSSTTDPLSPLLAAFQEALGARGYEEGKTISIDYKFAQHRDELASLATELVKDRVDVIVAAGSEAVVAARDATKTIPIVMANSGDAIRAGFTHSLSRPAET